MNNKRHNNGKSNGFTLLEAILAMALSALVAGAIYPCMSMSFKAWQDGNDAIKPVRQAAAVAEFIRDDIESAFVPVEIAGGEFVSMPDGDGLRWVCTTGSGESTPLRKVELRLEDDPDSDGQILLREVVTNLLAPEIVVPAAEVLCTDVRSMELAFYDGEFWQSDWDSRDQDNQVPKAIRVKLEFGRPGSNDDAETYSAEWVFLTTAGKPELESTDRIKRRAGGFGL